MQKMRRMGFKIPDIYRVDIDKLEDKPWLTEKSRISEFFNYGILSKIMICVVQVSQI